MLGQLAIQIPKCYSWLDTNQVRIDVDIEQSSHEPRKIQHDAWTKRLARKACSPSSREDRQGVLDGVFDAVRDIIAMTGSDHRDGCDLVQARIAGVHLRVQWITKDLSIENPSQIRLDSSLFCFHNAPWTTGPELICTRLPTGQLHSTVLHTVSEINHHANGKPYG